MTSKQLANVLIKVLGLSFAIHGIPTVLNALYFLLSSVRHLPNGGLGQVIASAAASGLIPVGLGLVMIGQSLKIAGLMFPKEDV